MRTLRFAALAALTLVVGAGCATYSDHTRAARESLARGDLQGSEAQLNEMLGVESSRELPAEWGSETALAVLERATVLQAMGDYATSARDYSAAEKELELLDIANDDVGSIGKYLFSDDSAKYKAPPTEKLLVNAFNMVNYLARGDLQGASVEARRFTVMRKYLEDYFPGTSHGAFGSYLAGFVFEQRGEYDVAMRYYDEVLQQGDAPSLHAAIRRLAPRSSYRTDRLDAVIEGGEAPAEGEGEILVILKTGRVSVKEPARIPIGAALGLASNYVSGDTKVLEYGMFKVVSYPELVATRDTYTGGSVHVAGAPTAIDRVTDVEAEIAREYEQVKPKILGAALTRMITRAVAAEGARAAGRQQSSGLGFLAAALVEGTMVALDKPDTRSWSTLPSQVYLTRIRVPAGAHEVAVDLNGGRGTRLARTVEVPAGGFAVADFTTLR
jgi:uncharacterized protein